MLLVAALSVVGFGVPLAVSVQRSYRNEALLRLSEEAARAVAAVPASYASEADAPELPDGGGDVSVALYDVDGRIVVGDGPPQADATVARQGSADAMR
jgi:hypothetical protein